MQDCFICDDCNDKLESSYAFKQQCLDVYQRINPSYQQEHQQQYEEEDEELIDPFSSESHKEEQEMFIIGESGGEGSIAEDPEGKAFIVSEDKKFIVNNEDDGKDQFEDSDTTFDNIYLEFEPEDGIEVKTPKSTGIVVSRKSYTVEEKLNIIKFAEENNNRVAARNFAINESSVRCFRRQKEMLLKMNPQKKSNRKANPHWPQLEEELKQYVINHPAEHGSKAKLKDIKREAIKIATKHGIEKFNGSNSYIFKFMQRHQLPSASPRPRKVKLETQAEWNKRKILDSLKILIFIFTHFTCTFFVLLFEKFSSFGFPFSKLHKNCSKSQSKYFLVLIYFF